MGDATGAIKADGAMYGMGQNRYPPSLTHIVNPIRAPRRNGTSRQDPKDIFASAEKSTQLYSIGYLGEVGQTQLLGAYGWVYAKAIEDAL
jgi:hypothetical protein